MAEKPRARRKSTELSLEKVIREALKDQRYSLKIQPPNKSSWVFLLENEQVTIGRSPECLISIEDNNVSREHAVVYREQEEFFIEDLASTNGTYLNDVKIVRSLLRPHDHIHIGSHVLVFEYREA